MTTDQTPAIEVLARLLCAADAHVHGNAPWEQLYTTVGRSVQDGYRDAARWLLPRMTVATAPAAVSVPPPADQTALRAAVIDALYEARRAGLGGMSEAAAVAHMADAVLAVLPEQTDRGADTFAAIRPQTLTALASHIDARSVAILRPESQTYAEWQTMAALLRRVAAEEQAAETHSCRSCAGVDPDTCLMNPDRPKRPPMDPVHILGIDGAPCIPDHGVVVYCPGCADSEEQPAETAEDPARIDRLRPEFTEHASVESIDVQLRRARSQQRRWHLRVEWLISLRQARMEQKGRGEWPAVGEQPEPQHLGGRANAEDCPACTGTNPPYPFLCPGPDAP